MNKPIRVDMTYTDDRMAASIRFFWVTNLIAQMDGAVATECISKAQFITRNNKFHNNCSILLDRHSSEGEQIEIDYNETR